MIITLQSARHDYYSWCFEFADAVSLNIPTDNTGMWDFGQYKKPFNYSSTLSSQGKLTCTVIQLGALVGS